MNMYNLLFGMNDKAEEILKMIGDVPIGRFRDAWIEDRDGTPVIAIYTRNGGGNRDHWGFNSDDEEGMDCDCPGCIQTYRIPSSPYYLDDEDDEFDSTYATNYFGIPPEYQEKVDSWINDKKED